MCNNELIYNNCINFITYAIINCKGGFVFALHKGSVATKSQQLNAANSGILEPWFPVVLGSNLGKYY